MAARGSEALRRERRPGVRHGPPDAVDPGAPPARAGALQYFLHALSRPDRRRTRHGGPPRVPAATVFARRTAARRPGRPLLRRDDQRPRRHARLRVADPGRRSLGDRRLRQGAPALAVRAGVRRSARETRRARRGRAAGRPDARRDPRDGPGQPQQAGGPMNVSASQGLVDAIDRVRRPAVAVGLVALAACGAGWFLAPDAFLRAYLFGFVFFAGLSLGCL